MENSVKYQIGLLIYPEMTQLDITAPHQVFAFLPDVEIHFLWKNLEPVSSDKGLKILPSTTFADCPQLDVICVPGGPGQIKMMQDMEVLEFLQQQAKGAKYVTSVCTGSLILAAAGLLQGYRAGCHWAFLDQLADLGVETSMQRVVVDGNRITGGGVTAGIDFGLVVASQLYDEATAQVIQLLLQYDPQPPFAAGSPDKAGEVLVATVKNLGKPIIEASWRATKESARHLGIGK